MIVTCENCTKTFNIQDNLIPAEGRLLQCGSCYHKWFFKIENNIKNEVRENPNSNDTFEKEDVSILKQTKNNQKIAKNKNYKENLNINKTKKSPKIIKNTFVFIISIISLIILVDTFKYALNIHFPGTDLMLNNLYESLNDLFLFFKDLVN